MLLLSLSLLSKDNYWRIINQWDINDNYQCTLLILSESLETKISLKWRLSFLLFFPKKSITICWERHIFLIVWNIPIMFLFMVFGVDVMSVCGNCVTVWLCDYVLCAPLCCDVDWSGDTEQWAVNTTLLGFLYSEHRGTSQHTAAYHTTTLAPQL